jgi:hypothetical protein
MHWLKLPLILLPITSYGFTPNVRSIVATKAFESSLLNNINQEFISDSSILNDMFTYHLHPQIDIFYICLFGYTMYLQYDKFNDTNWNTIELYKKNRKVFNAILTILFFTLGRNVQNAI